MWTWDSATQSATHYVLPTRSGEASTGQTAEASPIALAREFLRAIGPTTQVAVGPTTVVAGRSAYTLVVKPRTAQTMVGKAVIDVDSASGLPLGMTLYPRGSSVAALSEKFTKITLGTPSRSAFSFTPPPGAAVSTHTVTADRAASHAAGSGSSTQLSPTRAVGRGWASVAVVPSAGGPTAGLNNMFSGAAGGPHSSAALLQDATNPGPNGSRLLQTRIVTVMLTNDGTVIAGAVPASRLESAASQLGS
jgi:hypothetical protein